jgi:hypothetical protein
MGKGHDSRGQTAENSENCTLVSKCQRPQRIRQSGQHGVTTMLVNAFADLDTEYLMKVSRVRDR